MKNELIGIGVGAGEPDLLTLKALQALKEADIIFTPTARISDYSLAAEIVAGTGVDNKKIVEIEFPMSRDAATLHRAWLQAARPVVAALNDGKQAAFLTLGDPSVYSTWIYLRRAVAEKRPETRFTVIPGIMAVNAASAILDMPLVEGNECFVLLPLPDPADKLNDYLSLTDTLVIYKIGRRINELLDWVLNQGLEAEAHLVVGAGLKREQAGLLKDLAVTAEGYLSVAIIKTERNKGGEFLLRNSDQNIN